MFFPTIVPYGTNLFWFKSTILVVANFKLVPVVNSNPNIPFGVADEAYAPVLVMYMYCPEAVVPFVW